MRFMNQQARQSTRLIKARLDYKNLQCNVEALQLNANNRNVDVNVEVVANLYDQFCDTRTTLNLLQQERNALAKKGSTGDIEALREQGRKLKEAISEMESKLAMVESSLEDAALHLPNTTHPETPIGGENDGRVVAEVGEKRVFDFVPRDHLEIGELCDVIDLKTASVVTGPKFAFLKNGAALLELALVQWAMTFLTARGYTPVLPPDLVHPQSVMGTGFQPKGESSQIYHIEGHDLALTGTAEIPLAASLSGRRLVEEELPNRMVAFGHCFRTEAGSRGKASRGLYRLHQFSKVEMFAFTNEERSEELHEEMKRLQIEMFTALGLHFKVIDMATEELGAPAHRKYDVEAWMAASDTYGEISSTSNCTDYQSRRLNIRYIPRQSAASSEAKFVHTVNGTAVAVPRLLICILEGNQQADGSVLIPAVLQPFMGGMPRIEPVENPPSNNN